MSGSNGGVLRCVLAVGVAMILVGAGCSGDSDLDPATPIPTSDDSNPQDGDRDAGVDAGDADELSNGHSDGECTPSGAMGCEDGVHQVCYQKERIDSYACADGECADSGGCQGDRCDTAVVVVPGDVDDPSVVEGHRNAYHYLGDLDGVDGCDDLQATIDDEARELFLRVTSIAADHDLVVESVGGGTYGFFVLDGCDADHCLHAQSVEGEAGEELSNRMRWPARVEDDEVVVVVRPVDLLDRPFELEIYVESN